MAGKLTETMRKTIRDLSDGFGQQDGITNPTMCALERRGLTRLERIGRYSLRWALTEAGHAIAQEERARYEALRNKRAAFARSLP